MTIGLVNQQCLPYIDYLFNPHNNSVNGSTGINPSCHMRSSPSPVNLPDPGIEPWSPALQGISLLSEPPRKPLY